MIHVSRKQGTSKRIFARYEPLSGFFVLFIQPLLHATVQNTVALKVAAIYNYIPVLVALGFS